MAQSPIPKLIILVLAFSAGWIVNGWRWERDRAEFEAAANQKALEQLESTRTIEQNLQGLLNLTSQGLRQDYEAVNQKYKLALNRIDDLERMQRNNPDSADAVPQTPATAAGACEPCKCQPSRTDGNRTKRALEIARDCDLLAVRYNRLLEFYQRARKDF